jgi:hypothetical protein
VLAFAAMVGVAGDYLLRGGEWRLGFAVWIATICVCAAMLGPRLPGERSLLLAGTALAPFGLVWRDAPMVYSIDMLSLLCIGALTIWHGSGRRIGELSIVEAARAGILSALNTAGGAAVLLRASGPPFSTEPTAQSRRRALVIGCVLAVPPFVVVAALLASSDQVFSGMLERLASTMAVDGLRHLIVAVVLAWMATGWLRAASGDAVGASLLMVRRPGLPFPMVAVALYALIALLLLFVATQARVLFGGAEFLRVTEGLTVANYARDGFFQLVMAAGVVLGTLVIAEWLLAADDARDRRRYRVAGAILLALVTVLLVSATVRIWLYVDEFGLSIDRALASAAVVWVLAVLVVFAATTLRGRPERFAPVTLYCTIGWVVGLNLINPEARVVNVNMSRAARGLAFDAKYHAQLSADALPALLRGAHRLSLADCQKLEMELHEAWRIRLLADAHDWRRWNVPRHALQERLSEPVSCGGGTNQLSAARLPTG